MAVPVHASSPDADVSSASEPLRLGARFEPRRALGRGGYGRVELVHDRLRHEDVALKILERRDSRSRADLKREFRVLQDVVHPNLVAMLELVLTDELECIALEHVDGSELLVHLRSEGARDDGTATAAVTQTRSTLAAESSGVIAKDELLGSQTGADALPTARLVAPFLQLLDALEALEAHDLVHGDLKPANVLVERGGRVVVLDFGIARLRGTTARPVGTPAYMAPEQFVPDAVVTPASDRYALGVMLHEAITGSLPYVGLPAQILFAKLHGAPRPTPGPLGPLVAALLARQPSERPSLEDVRVALTALAPSGMATARSRAMPRTMRARTVVGRDRELAQLEAACDASTPPFVVVRGAPGLGKTTLVDELARRRPEAVVRSRCYASETIRWNAIDAIVDAIAMEPARGASSAASVSSLTAAADRSALALLFPATRTEATTEESIDVLPFAELVRAAARALAALIARRGARIVVIDDAQWADADSLGFLLELSEAAPALALVLTAREDDPRTAQLLARLESGRRA
ncbi:MAG: serine/threonine-protein kinase PknK, partial [Deltaproteobacteria bacterium]|nr:serine/threonine-protein kinase PknK [Deltaproteobacteria bacterium]